MNNILDENILWPLFITKKFNKTMLLFGKFFRLNLLLLEENFFSELK